MSTVHAGDFSPLSTIGDLCPWCEQPIPHQKFAEIRDRIRANERKQARAVERRLRDEKAAAVAQAKAAADARVGEIKKLVEQERDKSQAALAAAVAETAKLRTLTEQRLAAQKARDEGVLASRLREQREALEKATSEAVNIEKGKAFADRQKLEARLAQLQRQVAQKGGGDLGEGADLNLYEELKAEFPGDRIVNVKKGQPGADIVHTVIENGRACGHIVYDSKNRAAWRNTYVTQLLHDKTAAKADHALLVSRVFPAGHAQLYLRDGVIVVNPARAIALVQVIRRHIVQVATLRLSDEARLEKTMQLYDFITSDRCTLLLEQIATVSDQLLDLDVKEHRAHAATWKQRGQLIREIQQARGTLATEIELVVTAAAAELEDGT
jgi:hypothetical protein